MKGKQDLRMVAFAPAEMRTRIESHLKPVHVEIDFADRLTDMSRLLLSEKKYQVALLPASLPDAGWWSLWGVIEVINPKPEVIVYAQSASFELWSGVLDAGGYDVISESFTNSELQNTVLRAVESYTDRSLKENEKD